MPSEVGRPEQIPAGVYEDDDDDEDDDEDESPQHSGALVTDRPLNCWLAYSQLAPDDDPDEDEEELFVYFAQTHATLSGNGWLLEHDAPETIPMHQEPSLFG